MISVPRRHRRGALKARSAQAEQRRSRRLQSIVVAGVAFLIAAVPASQVFNADHPVAAAGIALQTVAGLLAAIQLWANSASDALVRWSARQIAVNRWHVAGLFDGRPRSLLLASGWFVLGLIAVRIPLAWTPNEVVAWLIVIPAVLLFLSGALVCILAMFMMVGALLVGKDPPPDGKALTALQGRLDANDWIWPLVGLAFVLGGMLQIAVA
ncbi:MAG TPA: hypothetical protein VIY71_00780 [Solirubrobacterales bacterium]